MFVVKVHLSLFFSSTLADLLIEYISTLEGDIAERDRLLEAIRSELGSTQSENLALRQEIAALKKVLLEGGTADLPSLNLPPPAPLPLGLGATSPNLASQGAPPPSPPPTNALSSPSSTLTPAFTPNTKKDLPSSPTLGRPFWGGQQHHGLGAIGGAGGATPVHTTLIPETNMTSWGTPADTVNNNINPLLNAIGAGLLGKAVGLYLPGHGERDELPPVSSSFTAFDTFVDANMFTLKSLDAYVPDSLALRLAC